MRVIKHWDRLLIDVADALYLSVFVWHLDNVLNMLQLLFSTEEVRQLERMIFVGLLQLNYYSIPIINKFVFLKILNM